MREELRDQSKDLENCRSRIYVRDLQHIELRRENQALRHKVNQYRKMAAELQGFKTDQSPNASLSPFGPTETLLT